jgi:hypothetical protein
LKESGDELFSGFLINFLVIVCREDKPEYIGHDIGNSVPEVI